MFSGNEFSIKLKPHHAALHLLNYNSEHPSIWIGHSLVHNRSVHDANAEIRRSDDDRPIRLVLGMDNYCVRCPGPRGKSRANVLEALRCSTVNMFREIRVARLLLHVTGKSFLGLTIGDLSRRIDPVKLLPLRRQFDRPRTPSY